MKKRFFINSFIVLIIVIIGFSPILYFNIIQNPFGIFTNNYSKVRIEPNSHFIKMRYVVNHTKKFDSFIFGNSRANNVNVNLFKDGKYYNMYYSLGLPSEYLDDVKLLISKNIKIKNIVLCVDFSTYSTSSYNRENDILRLSYSNNPLKLLKTYLKYIFLIPDKKFKEDFYNTTPTDTYKGMFKTGQAYNKKVEAYIQNNKETHINDQKFKYPLDSYLNNVDTTIKILMELKKICNKQKINLKFIVNPIHKITYNNINKKVYFDFLSKLINVSDFYDFSGINKVTSNNYFYYETSHFRPIIGDAMINFIQNNQRIDSIPNFGEYVTKQNFKTHLNDLKNQQ